MSETLPPVKFIASRKLILDLENPRYGHLELTSEDTASEDKLEAAINSEPDTVALYKSIKRSGVDEPIRAQMTKNGHYMVFEGNRRTTCLRKLLRENTSPPEGVSYEEVGAHVYPVDYPKGKIQILKGKLQTGKKGWGASNISKYIHGLRTEYYMDIEDIAVDMQMSMKKVNEHIDNWILFKEYALVQNHPDPQQFSYFGEASAKVRKWFTENDTNKNDYFDLISPTSGKQKIKGAAFGLRDFAKIVDDPVALDALINDPKTSMDLALEIVKSNDAFKAMPFLKSLNPMAKNLMDLDDSAIVQISSEREIKVTLKKLKRACIQVIERLDRV